MTRNLFSALALGIAVLCTSNAMAASDATDPTVVAPSTQTGSDGTVIGPVSEAGVTTSNVSNGASVPVSVPVSVGGGGSTGKFAPGATPRTAINGAPVPNTAIPGSPTVVPGFVPAKK